MSGLRGEPHVAVQPLRRVVAGLGRPELDELCAAAERALAVQGAAEAGLPVDAVLSTGLGELAGLVAHARLLISGDTGIAHLATAYGTPSGVLFGPGDPAQWGPPAGGPHVALAHPAHRRGARCAAVASAARRAIGVDEVLAAAAAVRRGRR